MLNDFLLVFCAFHLAEFSTFENVSEVSGILPNKSITSFANEKFG